MGGFEPSGRVARRRPRTLRVATDRTSAGRPMLARYWLVCATQYSRSLRVTRRGGWPEARRGPAAHVIGQGSTPPHRPASRADISVCPAARWCKNGTDARSGGLWRNRAGREASAVCSADSSVDREDDPATMRALQGGLHVAAIIPSGAVHRCSPGGSPSRPASTQTPPLQVYGAWHCGNDACTWSARADASPSSTRRTAGSSIAATGGRR